MAKLGLLVILQAKPGKEDEVDQFLRGALPTVQQEPGTISWYALRLGSSKFGIFDTFDDEAGRKAHVSGRVAEELFKKAADLFSQEPSIEQVDILAEK